MNILYVCTEVYPLLKTGGLADVAGALPVAQRRLGADARVLLEPVCQTERRVTALFDAKAQGFAADADAMRLIRRKRGAHVTQPLLANLDQAPSLWRPTSIG